MPEIRFDTGLSTYDINGAVTVSFNPTDTNFVERLFETFDQLDKLQQDQEKDAGTDSPMAEFFQRGRQRDQEMRGIIDNTFGAPVCEALFGPMNLYALADGLPVWCNLVLSVMEEVDGGLNREQKRTNARLAKYTAKYKKK